MGRTIAGSKKKDKTSISAVHREHGIQPPKGRIGFISVPSYRNRSRTSLPGSPVWQYCPHQPCLVATPASPSRLTGNDTGPSRVQTPTASAKPQERPLMTDSAATGEKPSQRIVIVLSSSEDEADHK